LRATTNTTDQVSWLERVVDQTEARTKASLYPTKKLYHGDHRRETAVLNSRYFTEHG